MSAFVHAPLHGSIALKSNHNLKLPPMQLLATTLPFSEAELIAENRGYLLRVLALGVLDVCEASDAAADAAGRPTIASAQPGSPVVHCAVAAAANGAAA